MKKNIVYILLLGVLVFAPGLFGKGPFWGAQKVFGYGGSGGSVRRALTVPTPATTTSTPVVSTVPSQVLGIETFRFTERIGLSSRGDDVRELQKVLNEQSLYAGKIDGVFGPITVAALRNFQTRNNLKPDGVVGPNTRLALNNRLSPKVLTGETPEANTFKFEKNLKFGSRGNDVAELQKMLNRLGFNVGKPDGIFWQKTLTAVKSFQAKNGLAAVGMIGPKTREILNNLNQ